VVEDGAVTLVKDHSSGYVYTNEALDYFRSENGHIRKTASGYTPEYHLTDHLGNVRVAFEPNGSGGLTRTQEQHYYPFGMELPGLSYDGGVDNEYRYNGKEHDKEHELHWYHYGARFYDPQLGRWHAVDPMDELKSPYTYSANNPTIFIDPDGTEVGRFKTGPLNIDKIPVWDKAEALLQMTEIGGSVWKEIEEREYLLVLFGSFKYSGDIEDHELGGYTKPLIDGMIKSNTAPLITEITGNSIGNNVATYRFVSLEGMGSKPLTEYKHVVVIAISDKVFESLSESEMEIGLNLVAAIAYVIGHEIIAHVTGTEDPSTGTASLDAFEVSGEI
jgi:RHS repeat-associated protein